MCFQGIHHSGWFELAQDQKVKIVAKAEQNKPTDVELQILAILWEKPGQSLRDVHRALLKVKKVSYSTVATQLKAMERKHLILSDESSWPARYSAAVPEEGTKHGLLQELAKKLFGGSATALILNALGNSRPGPEDVAKMTEALKKHRRSK